MKYSTQYMGIALFLGLCIAQAKVQAKSPVSNGSYPQRMTLQVHVLTPFDIASIDAMAVQKMNEYRLKGLIYGIWQEGKPVAIRAHGESMRGQAVNTNMYFRIGGIAETIQTTALLMLVDQKKIRLDDKLSKWLPSFPSSNQVTLKMLANSTSGYPDYVYNTRFQDDFYQDPFQAFTPQDLLSYAREMTMEFKPGTSQNYSHTNYLLLGLVLEQVTDKKYAQIVRAVLDKKDLNQMGFSLQPYLPKPVWHAYTSERNGVYEDSSFWDPSWTSFSGAAYSNIETLGKWSYVFGEGLLISPRSKAIMSAPDTVGSGANVAQKYFAMGFGVVNGWYVQNPSFAGYAGFFGYLPKDKVSVIVFTTQAYNTKGDHHDAGKEIFKEIINKVTPHNPVSSL